MAIHRENEDEIEESKSLIIVSTAKVIEYLEPSMSIELLCKFPDNSAYDFDYSQSTIWSPLAPRPFRPMDFEYSSMTPRNLCCDDVDDDEEVGLDLRFSGRSSVKKVGSRLRKKVATTAFNLNLNLFKGMTMKMRKNQKIMVSDLSPTPPRIRSSCNPIIIKGWAKMLKAASKQFKRRKMKKDSIAHVMLPKSL